MTEEEARERVCPFFGTNCIGSDCMAWRWFNENDASNPLGYCGLAGKPSNARKEE